MAEDEKRPVGRPKNVSPPGGTGEIPSDLMSQDEENILLNNIRSIGEFGTMLLLSCKLLRHKDHLARQVDRLERQVADLRTTVQREQQRLDTLKGARREFVAG